ncbi:hypothetical protein C7405_101678 [Paraburkholderia caballeronis]|uniref:hypothetical protein n=1 Tax=Paraburkholderia caballeronis TaxID=416943 RepID=UPI001066F8DB|nr:hypothetical protein [Paraburkholderia caballeronis]TDV39559.1 hypothetical protein C7405_101678 [Paraburkholderia caballeronis]
MATAKQLIAAREEAIARLRAQGESAATEQEISEEMADVLAEWAADAVLDREMYGEPDDTPHIESCDMWGTGEGCYHGRM